MTSKNVAQLVMKYEQEADAARKESEKQELLARVYQALASELKWAIEKDEKSQTRTADEV